MTTKSRLRLPDVGVLKLGNVGRTPENGAAAPFPCFVASEETLQGKRNILKSFYLLHMTIYLVVVVGDKNYSGVVVCLSRVTKSDRGHTKSEIY